MNQTDTAILPRARRANDYLIGHKRFREPEMLFDEFWREGELALFFGAAGSGKSVLAVQLADALSRGGGLHGFRGPRGRRRTLYVDLRHTDEQFLMRCGYSAVTRGRPHRFPKNLLRDRPAACQDLCEWLRAYVTANRVQDVIVDDLSAVKNTHDGTRETLDLMRRLRSLRDELRISILVLAESSEPPRGRPVSETDLGRSRVLCTAADSVFAAGRGRSCGGDHYLVQTRARSSRLYWTWRNAPTAHVTRTETGLLSFDFDERFGEKMTEEKRRLICEVSRLYEVEGKTFREIARQLGISKSWACDLYRKWTPAMEIGLQEEEDDRAGGNTAGRECAPSNEDSAGMDQAGTPPYRTTPASQSLGHPSSNQEGSWVAAPLFQGADGVVRPRSQTTQNSLKPTSPDVEENHPVSQAKNACLPPLLRKEGSLPDIDAPAIPFAAALARRSIYDLALGHDGYGREIYIETRCDHTGKPTLWYQLDKKGLKRRFTRDPLGIRVEHLDAGPFL